jgi:hypothetical protein
MKNFKLLRGYKKWSNTPFHILSGLDFATLYPEVITISRIIPTHLSGTTNPCLEIVLNR